MGHLGVGGMGYSWVNGENNRCYSYLSQMQGGEGWGGVYVMQGWGGSCRGGVCHAGVGWVM